MAFGDADRLTFVSDFAVDVVFGNTTVKGNLDSYDNRDQAMAGYADVVERLRVVEIITGSLPGLQNESAITVDGVSAKVRDILQTADGAFTNVYFVTP